MRFFAAAGAALSAGFFVSSVAAAPLGDGPSLADLAHVCVLYDFLGNMKLKVPIITTVRRHKLLQGHLE